MLQRSSEWFSIREGRFTASQIHRLLGDGKRDMTAKELRIYKENNPKGKRKTIDTYGSGLVTYAQERAIESIYGRGEDNIVSFDMQRGIELESLAFKKFQELKALEFLECREVGFFTWGKNGGASPDGMVSDGSCLEIKCPKREKFFRLVANGIIEIDNVYVAQMQMQMLCTGAKKTYFFNYLVENGVEYWHEIVVPRDEVMISKIKKRISIAAIIKRNYIKKINQNKQF